MAGLQCVCGDVFEASCTVEPSGCVFAWLLLLISAMVHATHYCTEDDCESDDECEVNTMYSQHTFGSLFTRATYTTLLLFARIVGPLVCPEH